MRMLDLGLERSRACEAGRLHHTNIRHPDEARRELARSCGSYKNGNVMVINLLRSPFYAARVSQFKMSAPQAEVSCYISIEALPTREIPASTLPTGDESFDD